MLIRIKKILSPTPLIVLAITSFIVCMVLFPTAVFQASKTGISAWWNVVFPALLPFFVSSELLMGYGVVSFMGVLLEPVMRPLFNLPGAASFVIAVGYTSGFPISASLSARLRKDKLCTRFEAERLMCFTNNASPLFMLVAVGVGMFHNPRLGVLIALSHYTASLILGLVLRFFKTQDPEFVPIISQQGGIMGRALLEMKKSFRANPRPFGKMLGDAISSSINKLLVIGGFIIIFSVIIKISVITGIMGTLVKIISLSATPLGFTNSSIQSLGWGFFEITLGTKAASEAIAPLTQNLTTVSIILGWSGISVLAQVAAMINETDLKMGLFVVCRFIQAVLAGIICFTLAHIGYVCNWLAQPISASTVVSAYNPSWFQSISFFSKLCIYSLTIWITLAALVYLLRTFSVIRFKI